MTQSLPTRRLEVGYEDVSTLPLRDLPWIGCLEEEIDGLSQVREGVFDGTALTRDVELRAERHIRVVFPLDDGCEEPIVWVRHR